MGKPDGIEQRDWDAAEAVGEAVYGRHERGWVRWPLFDGHNLRVSIARAIATARDEGQAEQRERDAHIVTNYPAWVANTDEDAERTGMLGRQTTRADLAAAIRKGEP